VNTPAAVLPAAVALALTATGCVSEGSEPGPPLTVHCRAESFPPPHQEVDPCLPEAVLTAAVTAIFTYRPGEHADQRAAFRTAAPMLTGDLAAEGELWALVWAPITAEQWQWWRDEDTALTTTVRVTDDDHPADAATTASRVLAVELASGDRQPIEFAVYAHSRRAGRDSAWLLAGLQVLS